MHFLTLNYVFCQPLLLYVVSKTVGEMNLGKEFFYQEPAAVAKKDFFATFEPALGIGKTRAIQYIFQSHRETPQSDFLLVKMDLRKAKHIFVFILRP